LDVGTVVPRLGLIALAGKGAKLSSPGP